MKLGADLTAFEARIGHRFDAPDLLVEAVTHASMSSPTRSDNQRLEFLGDRVLGLVMAQALLEADPTAAEGALAPRFNALVRKETCARRGPRGRSGGCVAVGSVRDAIGWSA